MKQARGLLRSQWIGLAAIGVMAAVVIGVVNRVPQPAQQQAERERAAWQAKMDSTRQADSLRRAQRREYNRDSLYAAIDARHRHKMDSLHGIWKDRDSVWRDSMRQVRIAERQMDSLRRDSMGIRRRVKKDTVVCLNRCDTTDLMYLRGVGRYTAVQILQYGQRLGGYVSVEQIREIEGLREVELDSVMTHLEVCLDSVRPIRINHATQRQLMRHPYISFEQSVELYEERRLRGRLHGWEDLKRAQTIGEEDVKRLKMYISFAE